MMHTVALKKVIDTPVKYLRAECDVRYWEDATVNGVEDEDGSLIPCREGSMWRPLIDLGTGVIQGWPEGTVAKIHYKVCDAGVYSLLDDSGETVIKIDGYVPAMMSPADSGYGDYVIMNVDATGQIDGWKVDLSPFEQDEED